jgi:hypothetical protein
LSMSIFRLLCRHYFFRLPQFGFSLYSSRRKTFSASRLKQAGQIGIVIGNESINRALVSPVFPHGQSPRDFVTLTGGAVNRLHP